MALCALDHRNPYELLAATILSAQSTDERVNMVTPGAVRPVPHARRTWPAADPIELEELIRSTGFYRNKTRSLIGMAEALVDRFDGEVPAAMADLVTIPGVGRKTANVVRSVALGLPGPARRHPRRPPVPAAWASPTETDPVKVEHELNPMVPAAERGVFSLRLILHGRAVCVARRPRCADCVLARLLPVVGGVITAVGRDRSAPPDPRATIASAG